MNFKRFRENLLYYIGQSGLSQREIAERAGIDYRTISAWVCGKTHPRLNQLYEVCKVLGITIDELTERRAK